MVVGIIWTLVNGGGGGRAFYRMAIGIVIAVVGLILCVVANSGKITEDEVEDWVDTQKESFQKSFEKKYLEIDPRKKHVFQQDKLKRAKMIFNSTFCFDNENAYFKKGSDGKWRSSEFNITGILIDEDVLKYGCSRFSLIEHQRESQTTSFQTFNFMDLGHAEMESYGIEEFRAVAKFRCVRIYDNDENVVLMFPVLEDADADTIVLDVNNRINKIKRDARLAASEAAKGGSGARRAPASAPKKEA
jgi:hypothetical protein